MTSIGLSTGNAILDFILTNSSSAISPTFSDIFSPGGVALPTIYTSLHTANPGPLSTQVTSEVGYTGYIRGTITRVAGSGGAPGWTVSDTTTTGTNSQAAPWPACSAAPGLPAKFVGFGAYPTGSGKLFCYAPIMSATDYWFWLTTNQNPATGTSTGWVTAALNHLGADPVLAQNDELVIAKAYGDALHSQLSAATPYFISNGTALTGAWDTGLGFKLAITDGSGGNPLSSGKCHTFMAARVTPIVIVVGTTPSIPALGAAISLL